MTPSFFASQIFLSCKMELGEKRRFVTTNMLGIRNGWLR